ncbi:MAG TPA: 16S rRNA (cytosine(967)-C(5))-methyltransferase RsmB [Candidatus Binatia bacterium]|nr:16S rRNA (cytosine(967)-C(5))-methyltransferase RsmB [Candidatus Binatia bacterium]
MPVSPARAAAFDILLRVERESSYASELLHSARYEKLSTPDHALATELVMGTLRWQSLLDSAIKQASSQPLKKLDLEVLTALRIAGYQLGWLTKVPVRAALHESVELVKRARKRSAASFVNAVLRKLSTTPLCSPANPEQGRRVPPVVSPSPETLSEAQAHPLWLVERWMAHYDVEAAQNICRQNQSIPQTTIRLRAPDAESKLSAEGISLSPGSVLTSARRVISGNITKTESFRNGQVAIQDEASQLIAALIGSAHDRILDCCAAPGGKTLAIADQNPGAAITAVEIHPHRAHLMRKLLGENSQRIQILTADARNLPLAQTFARILVDAPCSGTGTLARNPEIKWRLKPEDLPQLHNRQLAILRSAVQHLKPAGRLIYSTCSLEKEENEDVIGQLLKEDPNLFLRDCRKELDHLKTTGALTWPDPGSLTRGPYLRTVPGIHPCDGFFAAILESR